MQNVSFSLDNNAIFEHPLFNVVQLHQHLVVRRSERMAEGAILGFLRACSPDVLPTDVEPETELVSASGGLVVRCADLEYGVAHQSVSR